MRIFLTGGTGYVGTAVLERLVAAGHEVVALNRSPEKREGLEAAGATVVEGDINQADSFREPAAECDALIHAAFDYGANAKADASALDGLLGALRTGQPGRLIYTSGCWVLGETGSDEADETASTDDPAEIVTWRVGHERRVLDADGEDGSRTVVLRPGVVYGGAGGLTSRMFETAEREGEAEYIGNGTNHWSLIHLDDLARLYRTVVESDAGGVVHGVDARPLTVAAIAGGASQAAGAEGRTRTLPLEAARAKLGPVADAMCLDQRLAAPRARVLGWSPQYGSFAEAASVAYREWKRAAASG